MTSAAPDVQAHLHDLQRVRQHGGGAFRQPPEQKVCRGSLGEHRGGPRVRGHAGPQQKLLERKVHHELHAGVQHEQLKGGMEELMSGEYSTCYA